ncbi:MAG: hypothetical protein IKN72_07370 [Clostridia bacterium]|nr:hypothetical protein [Clostridia bacterium]
MVAEKIAEPPASRVQRANAKRSEAEQIGFSVYPDVKLRPDKWVGILRAVAIIEMIVGIIAAVIVGASLADVNGGMAVGVIFGGIAGAVVAAAPMMVIANMAERQEEMRVLLAKQLVLQKEQLVLQKEQLEQPAPPQE